MAMSLVTIIVELGTLVYLQKGEGKTNCRNTSRQPRGRRDASRQCVTQSSVSRKADWHIFRDRGDV